MTKILENLHEHFYGYVNSEPEQRFQDPHLKIINKISNFNIF